MKLFRRAIVLMLVVILSATPLTVVQAAQNHESTVEIGALLGEDVPVVKSSRSVGTEGWNGRRYFKTNGAGKLEALSGWQDIDGKRFYFHPKNNQAVSGFRTIDGRVYHFETKAGAGVFGAMALNWKRINGKVYHFKGTGKNVTRGELSVGWKTINKQIYYFSTAKKLGNRGVVQEGWARINKQRFYFSTSSKLGKKGVMQTGWKRLSYVDSAGKTRKGNFYFSNGKGHGNKGRMRTGLITVSGRRYYLNNQGVRQADKWIKHNKAWYYLGKNGVASTGWRYIKGLKYYFNPSSAKLVQDVRNRVNGPYRATINRRANVVTIYARDGAKGFTIPVKTFTCSVGKPESPTPTGTFNTMAKYRWKILNGPTWGQYATRIVGGILFHSVSGPLQSVYSVPAGQYNLLGGPASGGCVRLSVIDAKWIYDNCQLGMSVTISDTAFQPFDKPRPQRIPASQNWDPTDPAVRR